ncbi:MAG: acetyltransferase [Halorubrum sp. J07HR59]|nr:MAG: acetyltransferase [Halorubrum sp. J07HR59]
MFPETIETERLRLEPSTSEYVDLQTFYRICSSDPGIEEVTQYTSWSPHETIKETREYLERSAQQREDAEVAGYVVRPREGEDGAGDIAGCTGLRVQWDRQVGSPGIWLRKRFWGRGYSGERAAALMELAFDRLDLELFMVGHLPDNEPSEQAISRYIEQFGGRREGHLRNSITDLDDNIHDEVRYSVSHTEWLNATDGGTRILGDP